jgi:hypothetical protein
MWTEEKQQQFNALRDKEFADALTDKEQQQLEAFFAKLDAEEAEMLRPALERMAQETQQRKAELNRLQRKYALQKKLYLLKERLLQRGKILLQQLHDEQARLGRGC